jgi:hypothetical protein
MEDKLMLTCGKYSVEIEIHKNWQDTMRSTQGAVHMILLARDRKKKVTGVNVSE